MTVDEAITHLRSVWKAYIHDEQQSDIEAWDTLITYIARVDAAEAERAALSEQVARLEAENEHLKAALWLAQHPGQRAAVNTQEVGR